jgi:hypothetical protein
MAAKLTTLTHKIAMQLLLVAESCTICVIVPGGQSGNVWIQARMVNMWKEISCLVKISLGFINFPADDILVSIIGTASLHDIQ